MVRIAALLACVSAIAIGSQGARAASLSDVGRGMGRVAAQAFDLTVLRPTGMLAFAAGSVFFVATAPFAEPYYAIRGSAEGIRSSWDVFVYPPYEFTFLREVGDF